MFDDKNR